MKVGSDNDNELILDRCLLKTRRTIPFGWLTKLSRCLTRCSVPFWFVSTSISIFAIDDAAAAAAAADDDDDDANDDVDIFSNKADTSNCCLSRWSILVSIFFSTINDNDDDDDHEGDLDWLLDFTTV